MIFIVTNPSCILFHIQSMKPQKFIHRSFCFISPLQSTDPQQNFTLIHLVPHIP